MRKTLLIALIAFSACGERTPQLPPKFPEGSKVQLKLGLTAVVVMKSWGDWYHVNVMVTGPNGQHTMESMTVREFEIEKIIE